MKTGRGIVLEFQHSFLHRDERESRETFYQNMVWVVDGLRRVRDRSRFFELARKRPNRQSQTADILTAIECALLRDWVDSRKPVFFDFGNNSELGDSLSFPAPVLWRLEPRSPKGAAHLSPVLKTAFLNKYRRGLLLEGIDYSAELRAVCAALLQQALRPPGRAGFEGYMEKERRARARRRS